MKNNKLKNLMSAIKFNFNNKKPEIYLGAGLVFGAGCVVATFIAARKMDPVVEKSKKRIEEAKKPVEQPNEKGEDDATKNGKALVKAYAVSALDFGKLFGPAVAFGGMSVVCLLSSHNAMGKKLKGMLAAYGTLDAAFRRYRAQISEEFGADTDRRVLFGGVEEKVKETIIDENGKKKSTVTSKIRYDKDQPFNGYIRLFDDGCDGWNPDPGYSLSFLRAQQAIADDMLHSRGYLYLSEVFEMLGFKETAASRVTGWVMDPDDTLSDHHVLFGLDSNDPMTQAFLRGDETAVWLEFNVDGPIIDKVVDLRMQAGW